MTVPKGSIYCPLKTIPSIAVGTRVLKSWVQVGTWTLWDRICFRLQPFRDSGVRGPGALGQQSRQKVYGFRDRHVFQRVPIHIYVYTYMCVYVHIYIYALYSQFRILIYEPCLLWLLEPRPFEREDTDPLSLWWAARLLELGSELPMVSADASFHVILGVQYCQPTYLHSYHVQRRT